MKYFELFAGVGGFGIGIQNAYKSLWEEKNVNTAGKLGDSTSGTIPGALNVPGSIKRNIGSKTTTKASARQKNTEKELSGKSLNYTATSVPAAENQKNSSLPLNIETGTATKIESSMEQDICINSPLKGQTQTDMKSCVTTATTQKEDMESAPICVGFSEIDKYASQVLKYHYPNTKNYGDISKINWSEVPDFDLLTGGSPCQDFSIAGKRVGIEGERSGLVWEYIRCLNEKKPKYFIWENVKGVLSSRRGYDFGNILTAFSESGYSLWWQVLNAKDFGVPQNRERVFVVGFRDGCPPEVFFEPGTNGKDIQNLEPGANQANRRYDTKGISPTIPTAGGGRHIPMINPIVAPTVRANHHNTADVHFIEDFFPGRVRKTKNSPAIRKGRQGIKVITNEADSP